jgi:hypothetical protein
MRDVSRDNPNSGLALCQDSHTGSGPCEMGELRQLHGDPGRQASWNRLLSNGKVGRAGHLGSPLGRSHTLGELCVGSRGQNPPSVIPGGNTQLII